MWPIFTPIDGVKMGIGGGKNGSQQSSISLYQISLKTWISVSGSYTKTIIYIYLYNATKNQSVLTLLLLLPLVEAIGGPTQIF